MKLFSEIDPSRAWLIDWEGLMFYKLIISRGIAKLNMQRYAKPIDQYGYDNTGSQVEHSYEKNLH